MKQKPTIHQLGGRAVLKKYGKEYFKALVQKRWEKERAKKAQESV